MYNPIKGLRAFFLAIACSAFVLFWSYMHVTAFYGDLRAYAAGVENTQGYRTQLSCKPIVQILSRCSFSATKGPSLTEPPSSVGKDYLVFGQVEATDVTLLKSLSGEFYTSSFALTYFWNRMILFLSIALLFGYGAYRSLCYMFGGRPVTAG